jgi:hypothetical protein
MENRILFAESDLQRYLEQFKVEPQKIDLQGVMARVGLEKKRRRGRKL